MFTKHNERGERCSYEQKDPFWKSSVHFSFPDYVWVCPQTATEKAYEQKKKAEYLKSPVENFELKLLLSSKAYIAHRDKEPLKTYIINAKKDGVINVSELKNINQILYDFYNKPPKPTQEELEAQERINLVSKL